MPIMQWNRETKQFEKQCTRCLKVLPATADYWCKSKISKDGLYASCKICKRQADKRWRDKNPDYHRQWTNANYEHAKAVEARYRENNRVAIREKSRQYAAKNRDAIQARCRANYAVRSEEIKERSRAWKKNNPDRAKAARKRYWREVRSQVSDADRLAAGKQRGRDVMLGDGSLGRVVGRKGDLWGIRLHDPIKTGPNKWQRIVWVREAFAFQRDADSAGE